MRKKFLLFLLFLLLLIGGASALYYDNIRQYVDGPAKLADIPATIWSYAGGERFTRQDDSGTASEPAKAQPDEKPATASKPVSEEKSEEKAAEKPAEKVTGEEKKTAAIAKIAPAFDVVRVDPEGTAIFAGRAAPGAKVRVESKGKTIGDTTADENGDWLLMMEKPIEPGKHEFALVSRMPDGSGELRSSENVKLAVGGDKKKASGAIVASSQDGGAKDEKPVAEPKMAAAESQSPEPQETAKRMEAEEKSAPQVASSETGDASKPGSPAKEAAPDKMAAAASSSTSGETDQSSAASSLPGARSAGSASDDMKDVQEDRFAKAVVSASPSVSEDKAVKKTQQKKKHSKVAAVPASGAKQKHQAKDDDDDDDGYIVIRRGDTLWDIAKRRYGAGYRYVKIYKENRGKIRNPHWIYPAQKFKVD